MLYSLPIDFHFKEKDIVDRIAIAAKMGFDGFEICAGFDGVDPTAVRREAEKYGITPVGVSLQGAHVNTLNLSFSRIREPIENTLKFAKEAGFTKVPILGGCVASPLDQPKSIIIENLKRAGDLAAKYGITLLLEPLNNIMEHYNQYLVTSVMGFEILKCVDMPNVKMLYDFFHMQVNEGNVLHNLGNNMEWVEHLHIVGIPNHQEPFQCELNYPYILKKLEELGFNGYAGLEYFPTYDSYKSVPDSLRYLKETPVYLGGE